MDSIPQIRMGADSRRARSTVASDNSSLLEGKTRNGSPIDAGSPMEGKSQTTTKQPPAAPRFSKPSPFGNSNLFGSTSSPWVFLPPSGAPLGTRSRPFLDGTSVESTSTTNKSCPEPDDVWSKALYAYHSGGQKSSRTDSYSQLWNCILPHDGEWFRSCEKHNLKPLLIGPIDQLLQGAENVQLALAMDSKRFTTTKRDLDFESFFLEFRASVSSSRVCEAKFPGTIIYDDDKRFNLHPFTVHVNLILNTPFMAPCTNIRQYLSMPTSKEDN